MTAAGAQVSGGEALVAAYEALRSRVLAGSACGGHFGLVLLLRAGVAAWLARGSTGGATVQPAAAPDRHAAAPAVSGEVHADLVRVLANMALAGRREMSR